MAELKSALDIAMEKTDGAVEEKGAAKTAYEAALERLAEKEETTPVGSVNAEAEKKEAETFVAKRVGTPEQELAESKKQPTPPSIATEGEMEKALLGVLALSAKGKLSEQEVEALKTAFPSPSTGKGIMLANSADLAGEKMAVAYIDPKGKNGLTPEQIQMEHDAVKKHFPNVEFTTRKDEQGRDVDVMVGVDAKTANAVINMEKEALAKGVGKEQAKEAPAKAFTPEKAALGAVPPVLATSEKIFPMKAKSVSGAQVTNHSKAAEILTMDGTEAAKTMAKSAWAKISGMAHGAADLARGAGKKFMEANAAVDAATRNMEAKMIDGVRGATVKTIEATKNVLLTDVGELAVAGKDKFMAANEAVRVATTQWEKDAINATGQALKSGKDAVVKVAAIDVGAIASQAGHKAADMAKDAGDKFMKANEAVRVATTKAEQQAINAVAGAGGKVVDRIRETNAEFKAAGAALVADLAAAPGKIKADLNAAGAAIKNGAGVVADAAKKVTDVNGMVEKSAAAGIRATNTVAAFAASDLESVRNIGQLLQNRGAAMQTDVHRGTTPVAAPALVPISKEFQAAKQSAVQKN